MNLISHPLSPIGRIIHDIWHTQYALQGVISKHIREFLLFCGDLRCSVADPGIPGVRSMGHEFTLPTSSLLLGIIHDIWHQRCSCKLLARCKFVSH